MPPHAVQFYNDDVFLIDTVSAFITAGLKENGAIIVIATAQHREELRNTLQAANNSSITYIDAVELLSAFMVDDWPNETRFTSTVGPRLLPIVCVSDVGLSGSEKQPLISSGLPNSYACAARSVAPLPLPDLFTPTIRVLLRTTQARANAME